MKERLATIIIVEVVVFVVLASLCKSSEQIPLCRSGTDDCDDEREHVGEELLPSFSSRYRALEYDETVMKLLMEMLLKQHNTFSEEDVLNSDSEEFENSNFEVSKENQSFATSTENFLSHIINASQNNKPVTAVYNSEHHDDRPSVDQHYSNHEVDTFLHLENEIKSHDKSSGMFQGNTISKKSFEQLTSIHEPPPEQLLSIVESNDVNRFESIPPGHAEHINMKTFIERGIQNSEKQVIAVVAATKPDSSISIRNILSSKYKNTKRTSKLNGAHSILHRPRPFDGFTETLPLPSSNYREHFKMPTTRPKKKINSLESVDRDQDVRGEIQLEILNRPISAGKPMTTTTAPGVGVGCENATSCRPNNKKPINSIKVKIGQKPAKMTTKATTTTTTSTTERRIFGKSGIRIPHSNQKNSVAALSPVSTSKTDGNLISSLASIVDSDAEDSDEDDGEN